MTLRSIAKIVVRGVGAVAFALLALYSFATAVGLLWEFRDIGGMEALWIASPFAGPAVVFALAAAACVNSRWTFPALWSFYGAVGFGILGFVAGIAVSLILDPDSDLAPLLGIFYTTPAGVFGGAIGGALLGEIALRRDRLLRVHVPWSVGASGSADGGD